MSGAQDEVVERVSPQGGVVVGDDGSGCSERALRYAAEEAQRRGAALHVVRAWSITTAARPDGAGFGYVPSLAEFQRATVEDEQRRVRAVLGEEPGVEVHVHAVHAPAAQALLEASRTADVLVVGSRGRGGFADLVLGSVADQCLRHAAVPVVVIH